MKSAGNRLHRFHASQYDFSFHLIWQEVFLSPFINYVLLLYKLLKTFLEKTAFRHMIALAKTKSFTLFWRPFWKVFRLHCFFNYFYFTFRSLNFALGVYGYGGSFLWNTLLKAQSKCSRLCTNGNAKSTLVMLNINYKNEKSTLSND